MRLNQGLMALAMVLVPIGLTSCNDVADTLAAVVNVTADAVVNDNGQAIANATGFSSKSAVPSASLEPYGANGGELSKADLTAILYLSWPQQYNSIKDRFGLPAFRNEDQDYYQLPNGRWLAINYNGTSALGYSISDSQ